MMIMKAFKVMDEPKKAAAMNAAYQYYVEGGGTVKELPEPLRKKVGPIWGTA